MVKTFAAIPILIVTAGCWTPSAPLTFPANPIERSSRGWFYDVRHRGRPDFALLADGRGQLDSVAYDDAGHGHFDRVYHLSNYANEHVPHLIVLLDSIPYQAVADRYAAGDFRWCGAPVKVIPPFPSLTEICFTRLLHAPPLPGMVDSCYDAQAGSFADLSWRRIIWGYREPWERRLNYAAGGYEAGLAYLHPREWYAAELAQVKRAFDESPDRITLVYFVSASAMLCRYGKAGLNEVLDGIERMCLQILYERQGAVKITLLADHGHNLMPTKNISLEGPLRKAGFHCTDQLRQSDDVVLELAGLVTYTGIHTTRPGAVAATLCRSPYVEFAAYLDGSRVIVRNAHGSAAIEMRGQRFRYVPIDFDVLEYAPVLALLQRGPGADEYFGEQEWFQATKDCRFPDAPQRLWDAFHGEVTHPPDVMVGLRDGFSAGRRELESFIRMASTHGSLNHVNSATFVMSMTGRAKQPMRTKDVLTAIEPGWTPGVR